MKAQEALKLVDTLLNSAQLGQKLNDVESVVFEKSWRGCTYAVIAQELNYEYDYIKQVGSQLWRSLSVAVGEDVSKKNLQTVLRRFVNRHHHTQHLTDFHILPSVKIKQRQVSRRGRLTMNQASEGVRWTIHDIEVLPENEWTRHEIIHGELFAVSHPHYLHQQVCGKISIKLDAWSNTTGLGVAIFSPGVIFSEADSVIPDVVWVSRERLAQIVDEAGHLTGAPELVVEVLSPGKQNELRDKAAKLKLYSVQGVSEYWIVNRFNKQVEVYRREKAKLALVATLLGDDEITSPLLPGFSCAVSCFFPE